MKWEDAEDIAEKLIESHPDIDPLSLRFTKLHRWVIELEDFEDNPKASSERFLEKIQMAWLDLWTIAKENGK